VISARPRPRWMAAALPDLNESWPWNFGMECASARTITSPFERRDLVTFGQVTGRSAERAGTVVGTSAARVAITRPPFSQRVCGKRWRDFRDAGLFWRHPGFL